MLTLGVDLGQADDRSALVALLSHRAPGNEAPASERTGTRLRTPRAVTRHEVVLIEQLRRGQSYPAQVGAITGIADGLAERYGEDAMVIIDATGVGRPVVELVRERWGGPVRAVVITGGSEVVWDDMFARVPKATLVAALEVAVDTDRISCDPTLPGALALREELAAFGHEYTPAGRPKYEGHGAHDDLVLAACLAVWGAEQRGGSFVSFMRHQIAQRGDVLVGEQMSVAEIPVLER